MEARSTRERLRRLQELQAGGKTDLDAAIAAHEAFLAAILRQQLRDFRAGIPPGNKVEIARLTHRQREVLRRALQSVPRLRELVRDLLF